MQNPVSRYHGIDIPGLIDKDTHILFINSNSPEMHDGTSRVNPGEVEVVDRLLSLLENSASFQSYLSKFDREEDRQIGVISFYGKQVAQLRAVAQGHASLPLRVSTVDRFQGMERNIVIVSMVRSHIIQRVPHQQPDMKRYPQWGFPTQHSVGFAQSPNRLNVALSRAKRLLIIIGNKTLFSSKEIYRNLFEEIEANPSNKFINKDEL
jgi:superfamily I DNA and/or RNA helicase